MSRLFAALCASLPLVVGAAEPALDDPAVVAARSALERGQPERALQLLAVLPPALHVRYLRAVATAKLGRLGPASEELELLAANYPALSDRCAYEAGVAFEQRGMRQKAIELLSSVGEGAWVF